MNDALCRIRTGKWRCELFVATLIVGGVISLTACRPGNPGGSSHTTDQAAVVITPLPAAPQLAADDVRRLIELKDASIGRLENGVVGIAAGSDLDVAAEGFAQLAASLPHERLPLRNLAVARLLLLRNDMAKDAERRREARDAALRLLELEPASAIAHWIAANVELVPDIRNPLGTPDEARARAAPLLRRATQLEPDNAVCWFALYRGVTQPHEAVPNAEAKSALGKAYAASPRNIFLVTEWLVVQAHTKDPAIVDTLLNARQVLTPVAAAAQQRRGIDIDQFLSQAIDAAKASDWKTVEAKVRLVGNVSRPEEIVQSEIARVDVHPLEFVLFDFSLEFYSAHPRPEPSWSNTTPVKMTIAEGRLPALAGVEDLRVMDFDLNGLPDVVVLQPGRLVLLTQSQRGDPWTEMARLDVPAGMRGLLAADLDRDRRKMPPVPPPGDNTDTGAAAFDTVAAEGGACHDADPDIVVYGDAGAIIVRNDTEAGGDQPKLVAVANDELGKLTRVTAGVLVDVDHDSDLDLVLSSPQGVTIWQSTGNWVSTGAMAYKNISAWSQLPPPDVPVTTMVAVDWDRDVDIDIVMAEPTGKAVGLLENLRHADFRWTPFDAAYQRLGDPSCVALVEADGNVSWDLLSAGPRGVQLLLTATPHARVVNYVRTEQLDQRARTGVLAWDLDNDGFRDAAAWGPAGLAIYRGGPQGRFQAADVVEGGLDGPVHVARSADIDRDGDQDLLIATPDRIVALLNQGGAGNNWLTLYPMGREDNRNRCNHHAIGSLVELRSGGWYQAQVVDSPTVHFGLGSRNVAEQIRILWTNGVPQDLVEVKGNVAICERMILKTSCPYIYTMADGEFSFFSDCLWGAPLGLQTAEGGIAPSRAWEYLRIPGERLTASDGSYWIQLTEELWEAVYFDKVQLIAVDHPADVEIYSNEKVGPPEIAGFKIHTVRERRVPRSAVDQRGNDLRPKLQTCDGDFVKAFEQRIRQGLTPEHYIELDLGELNHPRQITLFLTGWIYPTDTSLNIAFLQDPETDGPRMPSVWVPDARGQWQETIGYMGYPGGKTKTIAVDLSSAFLTQDYRVRIQTTAEIYWDEAFFTVDESPAPMRQIPLALQSADLSYRGFSRPLPVQENAPRMYDHADVTQSPAWPPMRGRFTRYGAVDELLAEEDDQMAIIGAGDAITVRFAVPDAPVPEGWKRDFVLHSVGWDKDADLNTIYGQTVEPLPFRAMRSYPFGPDEAVPDSPAYREYLRRYQTREQYPQLFWRHLVLPDNDL